MAVDQFTKVTRQGWGSNILNSMIGAILGILLFFGSFIVLWTNEGKINWAQVAARSVAVDAAQMNPSTDGSFIAATGAFVSGEQLGDSPYLHAGDYLKLERQVEMFAWEERERRDTQRETGGGSTTRTTYEYTKGWTSSPEDSSSFEYPQNHTNPPQSVKSAEWVVSSAKVGAYEVQPDQIEMPDAAPVSLTPEMVLASSTHKLVGQYLFIGKGTLDQPQIGDIRIQYKAVPNNIRVTAFGVQQGAAIVPYMYRGESSFYRALPGDRAASIARLQAEHRMLTWILRFAGFLMMWIGMSLVLKPITAFLNVLPMLGNVSGCMIGVATFGIALVLSAITIVVSIIAHSLLALTILVLLIIGGFVLWGKILNQRAVAST